MLDEGGGDFAMQEEALAAALELRIGHRDGGEKRMGVGVGGGSVKDIGRRDFDEMAEIENGDAMGDVFDHG